MAVEVLVLEGSPGVNPQLLLGWICDTSERVMDGEW